MEAKDIIARAESAEALLSEMRDHGGDYWNIVFNSLNHVRHLAERQAARIAELQDKALEMGEREAEWNYGIGQLKRRIAELEALATRIADDNNSKHGCDHSRWAQECLGKAASSPQEPSKAAEGETTK